MAELYTTGVNRVFYKAENFAAGKTVTAYFWSPALVKSALQTLTELEEGLYYIDYNFAVAGVYGGKFYEDGVGKAPGAFQVADSVKTAIEAAGSHLALIKAVTDALSVAAATKLALSAGTIVVGAAVAGTLSTTQMTANLTEATNDHYNGRIIIWTSGVLANQATDITDYDGTTKKLTFTAITEAPSIGDAFVIV